MNKTTEELNFERMDFTAMFNAGFNPIAYSVMMCEDTFYFKTCEEAKKASEYFEFGESATHEYVGWWYSIDEYESNIEFYHKEIDSNYTPKLIYLNETI